MKSARKPGLGRKSVVRTRQRWAMLAAYRAARGILELRPSHFRYLTH
jgi:hypothetical protein